MGLVEPPAPEASAKTCWAVWQGCHHGPRPTSQLRVEKYAELEGHRQRSKVQRERGHLRKTSHTETGGRKAQVATAGHGRASTFGCTSVGTLYDCMLTPVFQLDLGRGNKNPTGQHSGRTERK